jgi:hypothetical protein
MASLLPSLSHQYFAKMADSILPIKFVFSCKIRVKCFAACFNKCQLYMLWCREMRRGLVAYTGFSFLWQFQKPNKQK